MTTLKEAIAAIRSFKVKPSKYKKTNIADELLGKYKGVIPENKISSEFLRSLRNSLYDQSH